MKKWVTRMISDEHLDKKEKDFSYFAHEMGYEYLDILKYDRGDESYDALGSRIEGITSGVAKDDLLLYQYPTYNSKQFEVSFLEHTIYRGVKVVLVVHSYERLRYGVNQGFDEIRELNLASAVIVPTENMKEAMVNDGVTSEIIVQEFADFKTDLPIYKTQLQRKALNLKNDEELEKLIVKSKGTRVEIKGSDYENLLNQNNLDTKLYNKFGLVLGHNLVQQPGEYIKYDSPYELSFFLAFGMPVFVWKQSGIAKLIEENKLGFTINSLDEVIDILNSIDESEVREVHLQAKKFSNLLRNGYFTRKVLVRVEKYIFQNQIGYEIEKVNHNKFGLNVMNITQTLEYISKNHSSVARFGDGELFLMLGKSIPYQDYSDKIAEEFSKIIHTESNANFLVCIPDVFEYLEQYRNEAYYFWIKCLVWFKDIFESLNTNNIYGSTFISRPYYDAIDKSKPEEQFKQLRDLWYQRDILIVEGKNTRSGRGNDLFNEARSVERIICPSKNAFDKISEIEESVRKYGKNKLVLLMLGPTAKIVAYNLRDEDMWLIDLGHVDTEYEWFKANAYEKIPNMHKHTAEYNGNNDNYVVLEDDPEYDKQVILDLTN